MSCRIISLTPDNRFKFKWHPDAPASDNNRIQLLDETSIRDLPRKQIILFGETTQKSAPWSFCDTTGYSFLSSWNERS